MTHLFKYCALLLKTRASSSQHLKLLPPSLQGDTTGPVNNFLGSSNLFIQSTFHPCSTSKATLWQQLYEWLQTDDSDNGIFGGKIVSMKNPIPQKNLQPCLQPYSPTVNIVSCLNWRLLCWLCSPPAAGETNYGWRQNASCEPALEICLGSRVD